eukprot:365958-Chlamydomonas_euryale.AAC.6
MYLRRRGLADGVGSMRGVSQHVQGRNVWGQHLERHRESVRMLQAGRRFPVACSWRTALAAVLQANSGKRKQMRQGCVRSSDAILLVFLARTRHGFGEMVGRERRFVLRFILHTTTLCTALEKSDWRRAQLSDIKIQFFISKRFKKILSDIKIQAKGKGG